MDLPQGLKTKIRYLRKVYIEANYMRLGHFWKLLEPPHDKMPLYNSLACLYIKIVFSETPFFSK